MKESVGSSWKGGSSRFSAEDESVREGGYHLPWAPGRGSRIVGNQNKGRSCSAAIHCLFSRSVTGSSERIARYRICKCHGSVLPYAWNFLEQTVEKNSLKREQSYEDLDHPAPRGGIGVAVGVQGEHRNESQWSLQDWRSHLKVRVTLPGPKWALSVASATCHMLSQWPEFSQHLLPMPMSPFCCTHCPQGRASP